MKEYHVVVWMEKELRNEIYFTNVPVSEHLIMK